MDHEYSIQQIGPTTWELRDRGVAVGAPLNRIVEVAGPEKFPLDELLRRTLEASGDVREVVTDAGARYFGALLDDASLTTDSPQFVGKARFADWLRNSTVRRPT